MRTIVVALLFLLYFVIFLPVLAALFILRRLDRALSDRVTLFLIRNFFRLELWVSGVSIEATGFELLPDEPVLFVGNHRSYFDILSVYSLMRRPTGFVAKKEIRQFPILSQWMVLTECIFLDRDNVKEALRSILLAIDYIKSGINIMIFPEGTRNRSEDKDIPAQFKEGSLKIAARAACPIVPVAIRGTERVLEDHFPWVRPARVKVSFLAPFRTDEIPPEWRTSPAAYTRMLIEEELSREKYS